MSSLAGRRIVITRAPHQAGEFADLLKAHGAIPLLYPCIDIAPPDDTAPLETALKNIDAYQWLVLTSANTVYALAQLLNKHGISHQQLRHLNVAAVGTATASAALSQLGLTTRLIPDEYTAEALAEAMPDIHNARILLPQSAIAKPTLHDLLTANGAHVNTISAYTTVKAQGGIMLGVAILTKQVDAITFTSPSTIINCMARLRDENHCDDCTSTFAGVTIACIGRKTATTAHRYNLNVDVMPTEYTIPALITALQHYYEEKSPYAN